MRRRLRDDPPARSALWSRRCGWAGIGCGLAAVVSSHLGLRPGPALSLLAVGLLLAGLAVLLAAVAMVVIWRTGRPGAGALVAGLLLAGLLAAGPAYLAVRAARLPLITDVSTDLGDPPRFAATPAAMAAREGLAHEPPDPAIRAAQRTAYPDLQPLQLDLAPAEAYAAALKLVKARRWHVLASHPPRPAPAAAAGTIDAVARSPVMGFRDDVTIRVAALPGDRSRVDMRSASRFGSADLGTNAARVTAFLADLDEAAGEP